MPYEPDAAPASQPQRPMPPRGAPPATQWDAYQPTSFIPPEDDYASTPMGVSMPPDGRQYFGYRQPPTWQHASISGLGDVTASSVIGDLLSNWAAIGASAGVGYLLANQGDQIRSAGGAALVSIGAMQLPQVPKTGGLTRLFIAMAAFAGAYFLLKPMSPVLMSLGQGGYRNNPDDESWDEDDVYSPNDDDESDDDDDEPTGKDGARPSDDPSEPTKTSPWLREVR